jgi:hypothetical protein
MYPEIDAPVFVKTPQQPLFGDGSRQAVHVSQSREHMDIDTKERVAEIRRLNEPFRTTFRGGQILLTAIPRDSTTTWSNSR